MIEIELKARVKDRPALEKRLCQIAHFTGQVIRDDCYYGLAKDAKCKLRIRRETSVSASVKKTKCIVTYKKKEIRVQKDGSASEVNDEKETLIDDANVLELFLKDAGFCQTLKKHKDVKDWELNLKKEDFPLDSAIKSNLSATFELCEVPPLGDFLEIEILSPDDSAKVIEAVQKKLHELLLLTGLSEDDIENRYYSDMLREVALASTGDSLALIINGI